MGMSMNARDEAVLMGCASRTEETRQVRAGSRPLRLCFVAPAAWPVLSRDTGVQFVGGAEVQQCTLARAFAREGHLVSMVTLDHGQPEGVQVDGVTCVKAHKPGGGLPVLRFLHPRLTSIWAAMRRADADVYYVRSASMLAGVVAKFCKIYGRKSIYAGASDLDFLPGKTHIQYARDRWLYQYGLRAVDQIVVQNAFQQANCQLNFGRTPALIPSCYAPPDGACADRAGDILWVANIRKIKQPELCLEMARRLPHRQFTMIGGSLVNQAGGQEGLFEKIEREARQLGNVRFLGFVPPAEAEAHFNRARIFLNTSRYEGFPNTFLQSWARGVPVVAFVDTGSRDDSGPVYKVARNVSDAVVELERLMSDDFHWKQSSERCRRHFAANHSLGAVTSRYLRVFHDSLASA